MPTPNPDFPPLTIPQEEVVCFIEGCFDLTHLGHFNAIRQSASAMGPHVKTKLYVGVNPDYEVIKYKGPTLYTDKERATILGACKWVDGIVENVPYVMNEEYLTNVVFNQLGVDKVLHGDDPCLTPDGRDVYAVAKEMGKYQSVKRTESISTTELCGRLLSVAKNTNLFADDTEQQEGDEKTNPIIPNGINTQAFLRVSTFIPTARRFAQFLGADAPMVSRDDVVVYVPGSWDLFNHAHVEFLAAVRAATQAELTRNNQTNKIFLIAGIYDDNISHNLHGYEFPILNIYERALSALSCKHIDDIILSAPYVLTKEFLVNYNVKYVYTGTVSDTTVLNAKHIADISTGAQNDPYKYPKGAGMFRTITSPTTITIKDIVKRVYDQREQFEVKYEKKAKSEQKYVDNKEYVQEL